MEYGIRIDFIMFLGEDNSGYNYNIDYIALCRVVRFCRCPYGWSLGNVATMPRAWCYA